MRKAVICLVAALVGIVGLPAGAHFPENPTVFRALNTSYAKGDRLHLRCTEQSQHRSDASFIAWEYREAAGTYGSHMSGGLGRGEPYINVTVGEIQVNQSIDSGDIDGNEYVSHEFVYSSAFDDGTFRLGFVGWGNLVDCKFWINDMVIASADEPPTKAAHLLGSEFDGGISASAFVTGSVRPDIAAGASYTRTSSGFLFAFFATETGSLEAHGPEGQSYSESGTWPWIVVSEPTSGPWTYRINQAQSLRQGEVPTDLFLMELPAPESRPSLGDSGWEAQSFVTMSAPVFEGDHVTVDCWGSMPDAAGFATVGGGIGFADVAFEGSSQGGWVMQLYEASRDVAIAASGGSLELRGNLRGMVEGNDSPWRLWDFEVPEDGVVKGALATWGFESGCSLEVNTTTIDSVQADQSGARLFYGEDFDYNDSPSVALRPAVELEGQEHMSRDLAPSTALMLNGSGWISTRNVVAVSPNGQVFDTQETGGFGLQGTEPGIWSFGADGAAVGGALPLVCLVTLPTDYLSS